MSVKEKIAIRNLGRRYSEIKQHSVSEEDVNIYKSFLETNLSYNIDQICNLQDDGGIQTISNISFPFRRIDITFSIEFLNSNYKGEYTAWCPELRGCISQGKNKRETKILPIS